MVQESNKQHLFYDTEGIIVNKTVQYIALKTQLLL